MSNLVFNDEVSATWAYPLERIPAFRNTIVRSEAGTRKVFQNSDHDKKFYRMNFNVLTLTDFTSLMDFFDARYGSVDTFLFKDPRFFELTDENIGTGDGSETTFQITENGFSRWNIKSGTLTVKDGGVTKTEGVDYDLTYVDDGRVIFKAGKEPAGAVTVTCEFYRRVFFSEDTLPFTEDDYNIFNVDGVQLEEELIDV